MKYKLNILLDGLSMLSVLLIAVLCERLADLPLPQLAAALSLLLAPAWIREVLQRLPSPHSDSRPQATSGPHWRRRWAV